MRKAPRPVSLEDVPDPDGISRRHAIDRMIENARLLGATAVVAMRFDSSDMGQQLTEVVAYGTAVITRPAG